MFKFGDRVKCICYNDAKIAGLIMAASEDYAIVAFETKQDEKVLNIGCIEYNCGIYFDNTIFPYAYYIPIRYVQKVEPKKPQHNDNNLFNDDTNKLHVKPTKKPKIIKKIWKWKKNGIHIKIIKIVTAL